MQTGITFSRASRAHAKFAQSRSTFYEDINRGLMVPGIRLGARTVVYPDHELDAIAAARMAGKGDDDIRMLVVQLVASRQAAA